MVLKVQHVVWKNTVLFQWKTFSISITALEGNFFVFVVVVRKVAAVEPGAVEESQEVRLWFFLQIVIDCKAE